MAWAEQRYHECLLRAPEAEAARKYLEDRGITRHSIELFRLGYAPNAWDWILSQARQTRFAPKLLETVGLVAPRREGEAPPAAPPAPRPPGEQSPTQRHFGYANLAGYPAINLPNGFADTGGPTNAVIYAQPFRELEILALAKAYQDAAGFHLMKPRLDQATTSQQFGGRGL